MVIVNMNMNFQYWRKCVIPGDLECQKHQIRETLPPSIQLERPRNHWSSASTEYMIIGLCGLPWKSNCHLTHFFLIENSVSRFQITDSKTINQSIHLKGNSSVGTCLQLLNLPFALISVSAAIDNYLMVPLRPERADTLS